MRKNINHELTQFPHAMLSSIPVRRFFVSKEPMQIVVRCSEKQKEELISHGLHADAKVAWAFEKVDWSHYKSAGAVIDLLFEHTPENIFLLQQLSGLKIINSVTDTLAQTDRSFVRINGWPTFLKAPVIEGACAHEDLKKITQTVFACFNKSIQWLPDAPGFATPRVVSMIINEAYFALAEGVSTRAEIDTAMKLGTAYPFGPFEWSEQIGLKNIVRLLKTLSAQQPRYAPAPLLVEQAVLT